MKRSRRVTRLLEHHFAFWANGPGSIYVMGNMGLLLRCFFEKHCASSRGLGQGLLRDPY